MLYGIYLLAFSIVFMWMLFLLFPGLKTNIISYLDQQLIPSVSNKREITTNNRFEILGKLLMQLSFPVTALVILKVAQPRHKEQTSSAENKKPLLFLLIAFAASVPLILSLKQRKYYLIPSLPFYVMAISYWMVPFIRHYLENLATKTLVWMGRLSVLLLGGVLIFSVLRFGKYSRDREMLADIYAIAKEVPEGTIISTSPDLSFNWVLVAYMSRVGYLSLDGKNQHDYLLADNVSAIENAKLQRFEVVDLNLKKFTLLKRK